MALLCPACFGINLNGKNGLNFENSKVENKPNLTESQRGYNILSEAMGPKTSGPVNTKGSVTLHPGMTREHSRVQVSQKEVLG